MTKYFPALTGLRAVAAYGVFLFHFPPVAAADWPGLYALCREGHVGVSLFFTLSGFLICRRYYHQRFTGAELRTYALRRWARIYPVFFLATTATFWLNRHYLAPDAGELYLLNVTLLKGFSPRLALSGIAQTWSLTVEECFYLLAPLLFWLGRRFSPAVWVGGGLTLLALGVSRYGLPTPGPAFAASSAHFMLVTTIFGRSAEFLLGAAFALRSRPVLNGRATGVGALLLALTVGAMTTLHLRTGQNSIDTSAGVALNNLLLPAATGLLLLGLTTEVSGLQRLLGSRVMQALGQASFCFYLLHLGVLHDQLLARLPAGLPSGLQYGLVFLLTVAASVLVYYLVEKPLHRLILRAASPLTAFSAQG